MGGHDWWAAAQEMWRRDVRYIVVAKQTTLDPKRLDDFIWQTAQLRTAAQRRRSGNYFYENNRVGTLIYRLARLRGVSTRPSEAVPGDGAGREQAATAG